MAVAPIFIGTVKTASQTFVNADGTTVKTLYTAGASGGKVQFANATSDDTVARIIRLYVQRGGAGSDFLLGSKTIAIGAGTAAAASVNLLDAAQVPGILEDGTIILGPSDVLRGSMEVAVTAAKTITILTQGGDF
ncbi:MAG: hypothetical protein V4515_12335 [Chloroflexota bacterium]